MAEVKWLMSPITIMKATQWNQPGDHPSVVMNDGRAFIPKLGLSVRPGDWIIQDGSGVIDARYAAESAMHRVTPIRVHQKTGNHYVEIFCGKDCTNSRSVETAVCYVRAEVGVPKMFFVREAEEFHQRFKEPRVDVMQVMADTLAKRFGLDAGLPMAEVASRIAKKLGAEEDAAFMRFVDALAPGANMPATELTGSITTSQEPMTTAMLEALTPKNGVMFAATPGTRSGGCFQVTFERRRDVIPRSPRCPWA